MTRNDAASFDIVFVADARFEGGSSTALAVEIEAAAKSGFRCGLLCVKGPILQLPFPVHPELRKLIERGRVARIDPARLTKCDLCLVHHPSIVENKPLDPIRLRPEKLIVVLHHPARDRAGLQQYSLASVDENCRAIFGLAPTMAPVSHIVRWSVEQAVGTRPIAIHAENWDNLIDIDAWPRRETASPAYPVVIGRHARPDGLKWPNKLEDALLAYPDDPDRYRVRILGGGKYLEDYYGHVPVGWAQEEFSFKGVSEFLRTLDFYVYYHSDEWSEAFGRNVLEALATGLVVILPPYFASSFGDAAVYSEISDVRDVIDHFVQTPEDYADQAEKARAFVTVTKAAQLYASRLERLDVPASNRDTEWYGDSASFARLDPRTVLFASSNGIGLGHVMQQIAIADRLPEPIQSVFATMSHSASAVREKGYLTHFLTHHAYADIGAHEWNVALGEELFEILAAHRPAVFAYDATAVFGGVANALEQFPSMFKIWVRRAMWRETHRSFLDLETCFDAIIEPGELASEFDCGPTAERRDSTLQVGPVLAIHPDARMSAVEARKALGLSPEHTVVAIMLGSQANYDLSEVREAVVESLLAHDDVFVLELASPLSAPGQSCFVGHARYRRQSLIPAFAWSRAFDAAVSVAGYNSFHEHVLGAIPTLFVPNEAPDMDMQLARVEWARITGAGLMMRRDFDLGRAGELTAELLDLDTRREIIRRCRAIEWEDGAAEIAAYVEDHCWLARTDIASKQRFASYAKEA